MTWRTPEGERVLQGAEAEMIRRALEYTIEQIGNDSIHNGDPWEFGLPHFDALAYESRIVVMEHVGNGLLTETDSCSRLSALNESGVALLFLMLKEMVSVEIDEPDHAGTWPAKSLVLAAAQECIDKDCGAGESDLDDWEELINLLAERILWDGDFSFVFEEEASDDPPAEVIPIRDDYYCFTVPEPSEEELRSALRRLRELCQSSAQVEPEAP